MIFLSFEHFLFFFILDVSHTILCNTDGCYNCRFWKRITPLITVDHSVLYWCVSAWNLQKRLLPCLQCRRCYRSGCVYSMYYLWESITESLHFNTDTDTKLSQASVINSPTVYNKWSMMGVRGTSPIFR